MRALLSVYDKTGVSDFARGLRDLGCELISTGGTLRELESAGLPVIAVSEVTGFPEILDGRVKTLHPAIHGGLLARHNNARHDAELDAHGIRHIDLVAANLYPFAATIHRAGVSLTDALEQIDIGGPAMVRAAAKNFPAVIVIVDPSDYATVLDDLTAGAVPVERRRALAAKAFAHVSSYDSVVAEYLRSDEAVANRFPQTVTFAGQHVRTLRYGENPQQRAAAYLALSGRSGSANHGVLDASQLGGKELSFNNLLDADAAWSTAWTFPDPTVAIVKHTIPCGLASRDDLADAFDAALAGDPVSAFGGIVAANRPIDAATANRIATIFVEVVIAPDFAPGAIEALSAKAQVRLLKLTPSTDSRTGGGLDIRAIRGGFLLQDADDGDDSPADWQVVTERQPTDQEFADLTYAWEAVRHVKSNAIVLATNRAVIGVGSGQPNRVESVRIACAKAGDRARGASLASDAFFPFPDGIELAASTGVSAIVQPGGSIRDQQCIDAANRTGITMIFTGARHFRH